MAEYKGNNLFEKLGSLIPGYKGYSEREGRRDTDKILRDHIAESLKQNIPMLHKWNKIFLKEGKLDKLTEVEDLQKKLMILSDQIKFAQYGNSGFFDIVQVNEDTLDRLYLYDLDFKEKTDQLIKNLHKTNSNEEKEEAFDKLIEQLDALKQIVKNRDNVILEIE